MINTRRCIETHPKHGVRCEDAYQHRSDLHYYSNHGAMEVPITWENLAPLSSRLRLAWRVLTHNASAYEIELATRRA